jgi:transcription initiation factor IIE alpha subunit
MQTYRLQGEDEFIAMTCTQLEQVLETLEFADKELDPRWHYARYNCWNEECDLRFVDVDVTWPYQDRPAELKFSCPSCGQQMSLDTYLKNRTLLPVNATQPLPSPSRPA